jgi:hypothetical protein
MSLRVVDDQDALLGGWAILETDAAPAGASELAVWSASRKLYLGEGGAWRKEPHYFRTHRVDDRRLRIGPDIVNYVDEGDRVRFENREGTFREEATWRDIPRGPDSSTAASGTVWAPPPSPQPPPRPAPSPPPPRPSPSPPPPPPDGLRTNDITTISTTDDTPASTDDATAKREELGGTPVNARRPWLWGLAALLLLGGLILTGWLLRCPLFGYDCVVVADREAQLLADADACASRTASCSVRGQCFADYLREFGASGRLVQRANQRLAAAEDRCRKVDAAMADLRRCTPCDFAACRATFERDVPDLDRAAFASEVASLQAQAAAACEQGLLDEAMQCTARTRARDVESQCFANYMQRYGQVGSLAARARERIARANADCRAPMDNALRDLQACAQRDNGCQFESCIPAYERAVTPEYRRQYSQQIEDLRAAARRRCDEARRPPPSDPVQPGVYRLFRYYDRPPTGSSALCNNPIIATVTADGSIEWDIDDSTMTSNWKGRIDLATGAVQIAPSGVVTRRKPSLQSDAVRGRASGNFHSDINFAFDACGEGRMKVLNRIR